MRNVDIEHIVSLGAAIIAIIWIIAFIWLNHKNVSIIVNSDLNVPGCNEETHA